MCYLTLFFFCVQRTKMKSIDEKQKVLEKKKSIDCFFFFKVTKKYGTKIITKKKEDERNKNRLFRIINI